MAQTYVLSGTLRPCVAFSGRASQIRWLAARALPFVCDLRSPARRVLFRQPAHVDIPLK